MKYYPVISSYASIEVSVEHYIRWNKSDKEKELSCFPYQEVKHVSLNKQLKI